MQIFGILDMCFSSHIGTYTLNLKLIFFLILIHHCHSMWHSKFFAKIIKNKKGFTVFQLTKSLFWWQFSNCLLMAMIQLKGKTCKQIIMSKNLCDILCLSLQNFVYYDEKKLFWSFKISKKIIIYIIYFLLRNNFYSQEVHNIFMKKSNHFL